MVEVGKAADRYKHRRNYRPHEVEKGKKIFGNDPAVAFADLFRNYVYVAESRLLGDLFLGQSRVGKSFGFHIFG